MRQPIRIYRFETFELMHEIDNYETLMIEDNFHESGFLELTINASIPGVEHLEIGMLIMLVGDDKRGWIIRHREIELDENGRETEMWKIRAPDLKSLVDQRITIPPSGKVSHSFKNAATSKIMRELVMKNLVTPEDYTRFIQKLTVKNTGDFGTVLSSFGSRYKNLGEELKALSIRADVGWGVFVDLPNYEYYFEVLPGENRTPNQSKNNPVIFSPAYNSVKSMSFAESELNYKNVAIVGGQGEGKDRRIVRHGGATGRHLHEIFVDARDVSEKDENDVQRPPAEIENELHERGYQELSTYDKTKFFEGAILQKAIFEFGRDYFLGDLVTIENLDWRLTLKARIISTRESWSPSGKEIELGFDNDVPRFTKIVKRKFNQIDVMSTI